MAITIDFVGGPEYDETDFCSMRYTARVTETDEEVTVAISEDRAPPQTSTSIEVGCVTLGHPRKVVVHLDEPLGTRQLINAATGRPQPVNVEAPSPPTSTLPSP